MSRSNETTGKILDAQSIPVPESATPAMEDLLQQVHRRRRRRSLARLGVAAGVAAACVALVFVRSQGDIENNKRQPAPVVQVEPAMQNDLAVVPVQQRETARIRLFARVRGETPVFEFDRETRRMNHVGWVQSQQRVPIDMRYVPSQQQETFNAVLHRKADPFSL